MVGVGRDLCGSSSPTLLPKQFLLRIETHNKNQNQNLIFWEEPKEDSPRASERLHLLSGSLT